MAHIEPLPAPVTRIAGPHQSTVAAILRAVEMGLFTADQADTMIDRIRAHRTARPIALPLPAADGVPGTGSGLTSGTRTHGPARPFS